MKPTKTPREKFKAGLKKSGYDPDAGAKRLLDLIAKQKKEREEFESKYKSAYEGREMKTLKQIIEGTVVMSDFKLDKRGRKYKAHRATMGRDANMTEGRAEDAMADLDKEIENKDKPSSNKEKNQSMSDDLQKFRDRAKSGKGNKLSDMNPLDRAQWEKEKKDAGVKEDIQIDHVATMKEDSNPYNELDEARGRPAGAATLAKRAAAAAKPRADDDEGEHYDADSGVEADQHIHVQLKKAVDSDQKPFEVSFKNGKKHTVSQKVAKDILSATERLKPEHRKNVHDEIHQSYDNLMSVHRLVAGK